MANNDKVQRFIEAARGVHCDKYDYSDVVYKNNKTKVDIICHDHGRFQQAPYCHIYMKQGCPGCGVLVASAKKRAGYSKSAQTGVRCTYESIVQRARDIHGTTFDYSRVEYVNMSHPVQIGCPVHGYFAQTMLAHIYKGRGCPSCGQTRKWTQAEFLSKAVAVHGDRYAYDKAVFRGTEAHLTVTCKRHGDYAITPRHHICRRQGCPRCVKTNASWKALAWLRYMSVRSGVEIQRQDNGGEHIVEVNGRKYRVDGYDPNSQTVYEFHGTFFHGHPAYYPNEREMPLKKALWPGRTFGEIYQQTLQREDEIRQAGYNVVVLWEHDWDKAVRQVVRIQRAWRAMRTLAALE